MRKRLNKIMIILNQDCMTTAKENKRKKAEPLHTTLALDVLMRLTHMNRIRTRQDVKEFLFRIAFIMDLKKVIAKTGEEDFLALYSFRKRKYRFTTAVLEKYIGSNGPMQRKASSPGNPSSKAFSLASSQP